MVTDMSSHGVETVGAFGKVLTEMLSRARAVKQANTVESQVNTVGSPLSKSDIADLFDKLDAVFSTSAPSPLEKRFQYALVETAIRDTFNALLASRSIDASEFAELWDLLDVICILSDHEQCDPALLFWLVEELLDSQTIAGCRKVFDYLESRRERITARHFGQKNLAILRSCNELLRRLSRAEDTTFCGRVFIFLFQSFPLGDKSSVNLRGEYHTENVTIFDVKEREPEAMDGVVDSETKTTTQKESSIAPNTKENEPGVNPSKGVSFSNEELPMTAEELYPIFWSMQQFFNQPRKLFDQANFSTFKKGLEATMVMFKSVQNENVGKVARSAEESKRGSKRKRSQGSDELANSFNSKYLTSRDLFELEINDISFRRNFLVQVLIVVDFLLSLSAKAKEKLGKSVLSENPNKSVMYADQTLGDDDTKWALETKRTIADYLKQGFEGPFFYRVVETVLSRDKNWARWKIENCPSIAKPAVTPQEHLEAKASAVKVTTNKRLRPNPLGSLDLKFLAESQSRVGLERLKDPSRYQLPSIKSFQSKIELDDMDIDMARDDDSKNQATEAKASKSWRALRIAGGTKFAIFDKIERSDKIDAIFQDHVKVEEPATVVDHDTQGGEDPQFPNDRLPIVISGPSGVGKGTLVKMLLENHPKVFRRKVSHTTRALREGEVDGQHYFYATKAEFDAMRDGDEFLEHNNFNDNDYGTSRKLVEEIIAEDKVPVMEIDYHGIQQLKDKEFSARFVFLAPPDITELERRLRARGSDTDEKIQQRLEIAKEELEQAKVEGFHDVTLINNDLDTTYKELESYIFGAEENANQENAKEADAPEVEMGNTEENEPPRGSPDQSEVAQSAEIEEEKPVISEDGHVES